MKISIMTTISDPVRREDKWKQAIDCYLDLADEVVVVYGNGKKDRKLLDKAYKNNIPSGKELVVVDLPWSYEWNWIELPKHLNTGLDRCTGDWVIRFDIDQFMGKSEFDNLKQELERKCPNDINVVAIQQMNTIYKKRYHLKVGKHIILRGSAKKEIRFGKIIGAKTDLCQLVEVTDYENIDGYKLPIGTKPKHFRTGRQFWNYNYLFKTKDASLEELMRFGRAHERYFGNNIWGTTKEQALKEFLKMMKGRYENAIHTYKLYDQPEYIRKEVENLRPEQFGFDGWGYFK